MNFLILWILTILSSYGVMLYTSFSLIKNIFDNGYKFITKNLKEYGDKTQDLPINKIFRLSMLIPFYNLYTSFKIMEFLITQFFPTNTFLNRIEFSTLLFTIQPLAIRLLRTSDPALYFAGGRSSTLE